MSSFVSHCENTPLNKAVESSFPLKLVKSGARPEIRAVLWLVGPLLAAAHPNSGS